MLAIRKVSDCMTTTWTLSGFVVPEWGGNGGGRGNNGRGKGRLNNAKIKGREWKYKRVHITESEAYRWIVRAALCTNNARNNLLIFLFASLCAQRFASLCTQRLTVQRKAGWTIASLYHNMMYYSLHDDFFSVIPN